MRKPKLNFLWTSPETHFITKILGHGKIENASKLACIQLLCGGKFILFYQFCESGDLMDSKL